MWPYWIVFALFAVFALSERPQWEGWKNESGPWPPGWWLTFVFLTFLIGWRHEVGGDWINYLRQFQTGKYRGIGEVVTGGDPGYLLIEYVARRAKWSIYAVNLISATIFSLGLISFVRHLPRPWLALTVSVPYVIIVMGMGYTRQGIALGCLLLGICSLSRGRTVTFLLWVFIGATFHKSLVLLLPLAALAETRRRWIALAWAAATTALAYVLFLAESLDDIRQNYIEAEYQSSGAFVRLAMNLVPAVIFLYYRKYMAEVLPSFRFWFVVSASAIVFIVLFFASPSSTVIDRIALYVLPLQIVVFSMAPEILKFGSNRNAVALITIAYYGLIQFVWLNFAVNSWTWIPYRNYLFVN